MPGVDTTAAGTVVLDKGGLDALVAVLKAKGYHVVGPRVADGAVVYDDLDGVADLPAGWGDEQRGGHYRLRPRGDGALFGYTVAPQGWKRVLYPPRQRLFSARRAEGGFTIDEPERDDPPLALVGVRACELAAMGIQAKVFGDRDFSDPGYQARLSSALVVAVECQEAGDVCFCASMGTGPEVRMGHDIKLVEVVDGDSHVFLASSATDEGAVVLDALATRPALEAEVEKAAARTAEAARHMGRRMQAGTAAALKEHLEHPRWNDVAARCLTCGNCTMVCPTCFCTNVEDVTDLTGDHAERWRKWDSCFTVDFSYVHGGALRTSARARYRQWITHKLSYWHDQFGSSGCVGCGRCITWCPVGIDITEEVQAIHDSLTEETHGAD